MRILVVGDQHFRFQLPYASAVKDGRKAEWEAVKQEIWALAGGCESVVLLGDNFNSRHNHSSVNREFVEFLKGFGSKHVYIIAGNHERYGKETALDFLQKAQLPGVHIYTEPTHDNIIGITGTMTATFIPFQTAGTMDTQTNEDALAKILRNLEQRDVIFMHHTLSGATWPGGGAQYLVNEIVMPTEELEKKYKWVISGHIHKPQQLSPKTFHVGNIFTTEIGEHEKFVWTLDTEKGMEKHRLPVRGIYRVMVGEKQFATIPDHSIVKAIVTDRMMNIDTVREELKRFDASIIVEQYPNERTKVSIDEAKGLDLSLDNLLKVYSETRGVSYPDLKYAFDLLESHENTRA